MKLTKEQIQSDYRWYNFMVVFICFSFSGCWTNTRFQHENEKANLFNDNFFPNLFIVCRASWKGTNSNVCPYCCTLISCALCNYLDCLKKKRKKKERGLWNALCNHRWHHVNPCYWVPPSGQMPMSQCLAEMNDVILTPPL